MQIKNQWDLEQLTAAQPSITQDYMWETGLGTDMSVLGSRCSSWSLESKQCNVPSARLQLLCMLHWTADVSVDVCLSVGSLFLCFVFKKYSWHYWKWKPSGELPLASICQGKVKLGWNAGGEILRIFQFSQSSATTIEIRVRDQSQCCTACMLTNSSVIAGWNIESTFSWH